MSKKQRSSPRDISENGTCEVAADSRANMVEVGVEEGRYGGSGGVGKGME